MTDLTASSPHACPLCNTPSTAFHDDGKRPYFQCPDCELVHVPRAWQLDSQAEKAVYDQHENQVQDPGYRAFLSRLADPLLERLPASSRGLDFGCGPGPALAAMLREQGHEVALYDLYYAPHEEVFKQQWDFITATEVVEHLGQPRVELERLWQCLKSGGWLALMTKRVTSPQAFATWHYKNDPTHISFFSESTFEWLAAHWQAELEIVANDVVILRKPA